MGMNLPHDVQRDMSDAQVAESPSRLDTPHAQVAESPSRLDTPHAQVAESPSGLETPDAQVAESPGGLDTPEEWPLTLQVGITYWILAGAVFSFAMIGGAGWLLALILIAVDCGVYLKTGRGLIAELLLDSWWNRPVGTPSRYAPGESLSCAWPTSRQDKDGEAWTRDFNLAAILREARDDLALRFMALRKAQDNLARRLSEL